MEGFSKALDTNPEAYLSNIEEDVLNLIGNTKIVKRQKAATKRNDTVLISLTLVFTTDKLLDMI